MSTTNESIASVASKHVARRRVFDLDKFEKVTREVEYTFPEPFTSIDQVLDMDSTLALKLINAGRNRQALLDAKNSIVGASPKNVNQMVNTFRLLPPYSTMVEKDSKGEVTKDSRTKQTQAIFAFIRSNEAILQMLKDSMTAQVDEDEEDSDEENEA